jgi:hypothetical protein
MSPLPKQAVGFFQGVANGCGRQEIQHIGGEEAVVGSILKGESEGSIRVDQTCPLSKFSKTLLGDLHHGGAEVHSYVERMRRKDLLEKPLGQCPGPASQFEYGFCRIKTSMPQKEFYRRALIESLPILPPSDPIVESLGLFRA